MAGQKRVWRRRLLALVGTTVVMAVIGAVGWFVWLLAYRPGLRAGERYGIDVSRHQGVIDWSRVAKSHISFAYVKSTEGGDSVDPRFVRNWDDARAAGLAVGAYHYFTLCRSGKEQAANMIATVPRVADALPPAVDLELVGNCRARPDVATVQAEIDTFVSLVEAEYGQKVVIYLGPEFERKYPVRQRLGRPLWYVSFVRRPALDDWTIWQLHGFAKVDGITGKVDLDVAQPTLFDRST
jgi:lysozyme